MEYILTAVVGFVGGWLFANWDLKRKVDQQITQQLKRKGYYKNEKNTL